MQIKYSLPDGQIVTASVIEIKKIGGTFFYRLSNALLPLNSPRIKGVLV